MNLPAEHLDGAGLKEQGLQAFRDGDLQGAEEAFDQALGAFTSQSEAVGQAEMLVNLGVIHIQTRAYDQAGEELSRALDAFRSLGKRSEEAQVLGNLGKLHERAGDKEQAAVYYRQAIEIFQELDEKEDLQATLGALTQLQVTERKWLQSLFTYEKMIASGKKLTLKQRFFMWLFRILSKAMKL